MHSRRRFLVIAAILLVSLSFAHYFYVLGHVHQERTTLKYSTGTLSIERTISYFGRHVGLTTKFWEPSRLYYDINLNISSYKNTINWHADSYQTPIAALLSEDGVYLLTSNSRSKLQQSCYLFSIEKWTKGGWTEITNQEARHKKGWIVFKQPQSWALPRLVYALVPTKWMPKLGVRQNQQISQTNQIAKGC